MSLDNELTFTFSSISILVSFFSTVYTLDFIITKYNNSLTILCSVSSDAFKHLPPVLNDLFNFLLFNFLLLNFLLLNFLLFNFLLLNFLLLNFLLLNFFLLNFL